MRKPVVEKLAGHGRTARADSRVKWDSPSSARHFRPERMIEGSFIMLRTSRPFLLCATGLAGIVSLGAAVSPALAKPSDVVVTAQRDEVPTATVAYRDLNLASASGRKALQARVNRAVRTLCPTDGIMALSLEAAAKDCRSLAWRSANPQIETAIQRARFASNSDGSIVVTLR
jgi:UrcA family protein